MSGHYPLGFSSPNHQSNYPNQIPNQMVNPQMRNMPGVMGPMMQSIPNQMVNSMMGQQPMNYNQQGMPNPGMSGHVSMQGSAHVPPMHMQQPQNTPPQNTFQQHHLQQQMQMMNQQSHHQNQQPMMTDDRPTPDQQQFHMPPQQHMQSMPQMNQNPQQMLPKMPPQTPSQTQLQSSVSLPQSNPTQQTTHINANSQMGPVSQVNQQQNQPPPQPQHQQQQQHPQQQQQHQNLNAVHLCRYGQETVQDIVSRFQEVFSNLKSAQPPIGTNSPTNTDKKVTEQFRTIRLLFRRLRLIFDKCIVPCQLGEEGIEHTNIESLLPFKDEADKKPEPIHSEEYKKLLAENRDLIEIVTLKNKQLREIIDRIRIIIWEINTMLSMRRS